MDLSVSNAMRVSSAGMNNAIDGMQNATKSGDGKSKEDLLEVSKKFEAVLWKKFLDEATKPLFSTQMGGTSTQSEVYRDLMTHSLSTAITEQSKSTLSSSMAAQLYIDTKGPAPEKPTK